MYFQNIETFWGVSNFLGNTLPFLFFGVVSAITIRREKTENLFFSNAALFVFCEIVQYIFKLGVCDVDDVFLNCAFYGIGLLSVKLFMRIAD